MNDNGCEHPVVIKDLANLMLVEPAFIGMVSVRGVAASQMGKKLYE
jgi:hypothetical protein